jgi:hypothetical protein
MLEDTDAPSELDAPEQSNVLKGQDAFDLYKRGKDAWNDWAAAHKGWFVDFSNWDFTKEGNVAFKLFKFPGAVSFRSAIFGEGNVIFSDAEFCNGDVFFSDAKFGNGDVYFHEAKFGVGGVYFIGAEFGVGNVSFNYADFGEGVVSFYGAEFGGGNLDYGKARFPGPMSFTSVKAGIANGKAVTVSFAGAVFESLLGLDDTKFNCVPDFRQAQIQRDISIEYTEVSYRTDDKRRILKVADVKHASKYRSLRRLAIEAKDHDKEIEFFAFEQRSKFLNSLNTLQYFPIFLYNLLSNFGRSFLRPFIGLLSTWLIAAQLFYWRSFINLTGDYSDALWLSASNLLPFISWSRVTRQAHLEALYGLPPNVHWTIEATAYAEGIVALIFIFLIGLAIRNKLRL